MLSVDVIRERWPNPARTDDPDGDYCVLGAALLFLGFDESFPGPGTAAPLLGIWSTDAIRIAALNDCGLFEEAWAALDEALREIDE